MSNTIVATGNVGKDPEIRKTQDGLTIASFSLGSNGRKKDQTNWFNVSVFGKTADFVAEYVKKGTGLYVVGSLEIEQYEKDGEKKTAYKIYADKVNFNGGKKEEKPQETASVTNDMSEEIPWA